LQLKTNKKPIITKVVSAYIGGIMLAGFVASANPGTVDVTDVTDWTTQPGETPNEVVTISSDPYLGYSGGVYAGINDLSVTLAGADNGLYGGFCIDPYHFSSPTGDVTPGYTIDSLTSGLAPKAPGTLNAYTATEIEDLWIEFYSPTMSAPAAAGLQVAIWELVVSNTIATPATAADVVTFSGNTYSASADLASLATFTGTPANLEALTGPGQDYVIYIPSYPPIGQAAPDGGVTFIMLALTLGALMLARPAIIKVPILFRQARAITVNRP
jgi:hypothetical protein